MKKRKYQRPPFLNEIIEQDSYERWLQRKARTHLRRDKKKRGNKVATNAEYKVAIHRAVIESNGNDAYTHEPLSWELISTYDNKQSQRGGREYKRQFALLPSVDHVGDGTGKADFKICSWRTNDSKSDMSLGEYINLCKRIIKFNE